MIPMHSYRMDPLDSLFTIVMALWRVAIERPRVIRPISIEGGTLCPPNLPNNDTSLTRLTRFPQTAATMQSSPIPSHVA